MSNFSLNTLTITIAIIIQSQSKLQTQSLSIQFPQHSNGKRINFQTYQSIRSFNDGDSMSLRDRNRIDYQKLNKTGEVIMKDDEKTTDDDTPKDVTLLEIDIMVVIEDINDLIEENPDHDDITTSKLEEHRSKLRRMAFTLKQINPESKVNIQVVATIEAVKTYIKASKNVKTITKQREDEMKRDELNQKRRSTMFLIDHIHRDLKELTDEYSKQPDKSSDEEIAKWKEDLPRLSMKLDKVAENINAVLKSRINDEDHDISLTNIREQFERLFKLKKAFVLKLDDEIAERDIEKDRNFNTSRLNIKLEKFTGYESKIDFFTFRSQLEKVYLKSTSKRFLPELIKNNFLADQALNLVQNLEDIDVIWERLKDAYGNPKIMLSKRLQKLSSFEINKSNNPEKVINHLTKIINLLQDLMRLAQEYQIEENLYFGDGLHKVYQLMGDINTTKFLNTICDEDLEQHEVWSKLISFLDKQKRVQQQKLLIQGPTTSTQPLRRQHQSHFSGQTNNKRQDRLLDQLNCFICQATNHVATNGPQGTKIVQYFACPTFAKMSPQERFNELKSKGLCFQCLYPGARMDQGKHKEGRCQRDFCCKHTIHANYTVKKHVLICDDHKLNQENKDLFEHYKARCITKIQQLEAFSKDMRLSYVSSSDQSINECDDDDQPIYVLQTIEVDGNQYTNVLRQWLQEFCHQI